MNETHNADGPEFSRKVAVRDLSPHAPRRVTAKATADERAALARRFGAEAAPRFSVDVRIEAWEDGWRVVGAARARVTQTCVVTLEPVDAVIDEPIDRRFTADPARAAAAPDIDPEAEDPPELLGDVIDVGEIAAETVALALPAHPRADGAVYDAPEDDDEEAAPRPFAALEELKRRMQGDG